MPMNTSNRKWSLVLAAVLVTLVSLIGTALPSTASAVEKPCGVTGLPACPGIPPIQGPWIYADSINSGQSPFLWYSFADVAQNFANQEVHPSTYCDTTMVSVTENPN